MENFLAKFLLEQIAKQEGGANLEALCRAGEEHLKELVEKTLCAMIENVELYLKDGVYHVIDQNDSGDGEHLPADYLKALACVVTTGNANIFFLQRRCSIGYSRAGRIIDWMEKVGFISPYDGTTEPREVLLTREQFEEKYGAPETYYPA